MANCSPTRIDHQDFNDNAAAEVNPGTSVWDPDREVVYFVWAAQNQAYGGGSANQNHGLYFREYNPATATFVSAVTIVETSTGADRYEGVRMVRLASGVPGVPGVLIVTYVKQIGGTYSIVARESSDNGANWSSETSIQAPGFLTENSALATDGTNVFCWYWIHSSSFLFRSAVRSGAGTWASPVTVYNSGTANDQIVQNIFMPSRSGIVISASVAFVVASHVYDISPSPALERFSAFRTTNGGANWSEVILKDYKSLVTQTAVPTATDTNEGGGWLNSVGNTTNIHTYIDETVDAVDTGDYIIQSGPAGTAEDEVVFSLTSLTDAGLSTSHRVRAHITVTDPDQTGTHVGIISFRVQLESNTGTVWKDSGLYQQLGIGNLPLGTYTLTWDLTEAEANAISSYTTLKLRIICSISTVVANDESVRVNAAEFQAPGYIGTGPLISQNPIVWRGNDNRIRAMWFENPSYQPIFFYSDDDGANWTEVGTPTAIQIGSELDANEGAFTLDEKSNLFFSQFVTLDGEFRIYMGGDSTSGWSLVHSCTYVGDAIPGGKRADALFAGEDYVHVFENQTSGGGAHFQMALLTDEDLTSEEILPPPLVEPSPSGSDENNTYIRLDLSDGKGYSVHTQPVSCFVVWNDGDYTTQRGVQLLGIGNPWMDANTEDVAHIPAIWKLDDDEAYGREEWWSDGSDLVKRRDPLPFEWATSEMVLGGDESVFNSAVIRAILIDYLRPVGTFELEVWVDGENINRVITVPATGLKSKKRFYALPTFGNVGSTVQIRGRDSSLEELVIYGLGIKYIPKKVRG